MYTIQMCHLNWNITWAVALEVININSSIKLFTVIYENTFFSARIVNIWNSLPNYVGDVNTVNQFKACLPYDTIRREMLF